MSNAHSESVFYYEKATFLLDLCCPRTILGLIVLKLHKTGRIGLELYEAEGPMNRIFKFSNPARGFYLYN